MSHEEGMNRINVQMEFDELLLISQCHSSGRRYPVIKNWFLNKYPEVRDYGMVEIVPKERKEENGSSEPNAA